MHNSSKAKLDPWHVCTIKSNAFLNAMFLENSPADFKPNIQLT